MKIYEVESNNSSLEKLAALSQVLLGRAEDTNAKKQISQQAFINLARSLGVNLTKQNLADIANQEPLSNVLEPVDPNSGVVVFKSENNFGSDDQWGPEDVGAEMSGDTEVGPAMTGQAGGDVPMPTVNQSEQIVKQNADRALKKSTGSDFF